MAYLTLNNNLSYITVEDLNTIKHSNYRNYNIIQ